MIKDYQFTLDDYKLVNIDRANKEITLQFTSTNVTENRNEQDRYYITSVTINNCSYSVTRQGSLYTVVVPYEEENKTVLELQKAKLSNLKEFTNIGKSIVVFKTAPTANVNVTVNDDLKLITASFDLVDNDSTITALEARLIKPNGEIVKKNLNIGENSVTFESANDEIFKAGEYVVEIGADYELVDGLTHNEKTTIGTSKATVKTIAKIVDANVQNYYVEKGASVEIKYTVSSNNEGLLSIVNIEEVSYPATQNADGTYSIFVHISENEAYGAKKYRPTVVMYNSETVILDDTKEVECYVLKSKPNIENFVFNDKVKDQNLTFKFNNNDNALLSDDAGLIIVDEQNVEKLEHKLTGDNTVQLNSLENGNYTVELKGTYDLDDDKNNGQNDQYKLADIFEPRQIRVISDYKPNVQISDVSIDTSTNQAVVKFTATNEANYETKKVVIDGNEYDVEKQEDGTYVVRIKLEDENNKTLNITDVVIAEDIKLQLAEPQSFEIFKTVPSVSNVEANADGNTVNVKFKIEDPADIMRNAKVVLKDANGNIVAESQAITKDTTEVSFKDVTNAGKYTVEVVADFDRVDGKSHIQERINSDNIEVQINIIANIKEAVASKQYANKNEEINITYTIADNTDENITAIVVNDGEKDIECTPTLNGEKYNITVKTPETAGGKSYKVVKLKYGENEVNPVEESEKAIAKVYVLKTAPTIRDYKLHSKEEPPVITFVIDNPDGAIINGNILIKSAGGQTLKIQQISTSKEPTTENKIEINEDEFNATEVYQFVLEGIYDLDDDLTNKQNEYDISTLFAGEKFQLDIEANVENIELEKRYLQREEQFSVTYTITSNTELKLTNININDKQYEPVQVGTTNTYKITYTAKNGNGIEELKTNKLYFGNNEIEVADKTEKIEILKQLPKVVADSSNLEYNYETKEITFKFTIEDQEDALEKAYVTLDGLKDENGVEKVEVNKGENTVKFKDAQIGKLYKLNVLATYDLDTDGLNDITNTDDNVFTELGIYETKAQLLKNKPQIENFKVDTSTGKAVVSYDMKDDDNSFISGNIIATNKDTNEQIIIPVEKGKNSYELELKAFVDYTIELKIAYDLDDDSTNGENQDEEIFAVAEEVEVEADYEATVTDLTVINVDRTQNKAVLQFKFTNASKYGLLKIKIGDNFYDVIQVPDSPEMYTCEYTFDETLIDKRQEITLTQASLVNEVEVNLKENVSTVIFKNAPTLSELNLNNVDNNRIDATFTITDEEATLTKLYAVLKDEAGNVITEKELTYTDRQVSFSGLTAKKYKVEILADYELVDGSEHTRVSLKESEIIELKIITGITTNSISDIYPDKGETITLNYNIVSNTGAKVTSVLFDKIGEYPTEWVAEGEYKVTYIVPSTSGIVQLKIIRVNFDNGEYVDLGENPHLDEVDVLKMAPSITNFSLMENVDLKTVTFSFNVSDPDNAFLSGTAKVGEDTRTITKDGNTLSFVVEPDVEQKLYINVDYDLDSNQLLNEDQSKNRYVLPFEKIFTLVSDYQLTIENLKTYKNDGSNVQTTYFNKKEEIQLRFNSSNRINNEPLQIKVNDLEDDSSEGQWYDVKTVNKKNGDVDYYYVEIKGGDKAGLENIEISDVKLNSGKIINKLEFKNSTSNTYVDILKDMPQVQNVSVSNTESNLSVSFTVVDNDDALLESYVRLKDNNTGAEIYTQKIEKGENKFSINVEPGNAYTLTIERNYNLDSLIDDEYNKQEGIYETRIIEISKKEEPNFIARNLTVPKRVPNGSKVPFSFENEVMSYLDVSSVRIDGVDYPVEKDENNVYKLQLDPGPEGVNTIYVESVKMGDKVFRINRYLSYTYEYIVPTAINISDIYEDVSNNLAKVDYELVDPHNSIKSIKVYMRNSANVVSGSKELSRDATTADLPIIKTYEYTIEVIAEYDIGDGKTFDTTTLFTRKKTTDPRINIIESSVEKEFVNKGEDAVLNYKINTNIDDDVRKVFIGEDSYNVTKLKEEDSYQITIPAPANSGVFEQKVTQMQIGNNYYPVQPEEDPLDIKVLKEKPTLTHFTVDEENGTLSFRLNDKDKSLTQDPLLTVKNSDNQVIGTQNLTNRGNEYTDYTFNLDDQLGMNKINTTYNAVVNVTYELKPDGIDEVNLMAVAEEDNTDEEVTEGEEKEIIETSGTENILDRNVELIGMTDYNFKFEDTSKGYGFVVCMSSDETLTFISTNNSKYKVAKVIIDGEEYPAIFGEPEKNKYMVYYRPHSYAQTSITYDKVILENGASFDVNETVPIYIRRVDATLEITSFEENIDTQKIKFNYKTIDRDKTIHAIEPDEEYPGYYKVDEDAEISDPLRFVLKDSQNNLIAEKKVSASDSVVEFDIPNPPTARYHLLVYADIYLAEGLYWRDKVLNGQITGDALEGNGDYYDSQVNTSILSSKLETRYPKKGETITIDYVISSTKVVLVDKDDHENLPKAVNITSLVINGKEYTVEHQGGETYRIYYTVKNEHGIEDINISQINFSNDTQEVFNRTDKVEVLKQEPIISNYKTENDLARNKVKFTFDVSDPDGTLNSNSIYAEVDGKRHDVVIGNNTIEIDAQKDKLTNFEIKASYDLDSDFDEFNNLYGDENVYTDYTIFEKPFILTGSYNIKFNNIKTFNTQNVETKYFEKNEDIKVEFDFEAIEGLYPEGIVIDNQNYNIEKKPETENTYCLTIKGYEKAGVVNGKINSVILNSGNVVELTESTIPVEVLKDVVKIDSFKYSVNENNADQIDLEIVASDADKANEEMKVEVKDEYGKKINLDDNNLNTGNNKRHFNKTSAGKYFVSIYSTYDRDENSKDNNNHYDNNRVYYEVVTINTRYIEMKDVVDVQLYRFSDKGNVERVNSLKVEDLEVLTNCLAKVTMKDLPTFYSEIKDYEQKDGKLKLILAYSDAMIYTDEGLKPLEVTLDILEDSSYAYSGSFTSLLEKMREDPKGTYNLDKDYDLGDFATNVDDSANAIIDFEFNGTLNGNGHTIKNLHKPLFSTLRDATVENIVFKGVEFTRPSGKAVVTKSGYNSKIKNIHIDGVTLSVDNNYRDNNATFAVDLHQNSVVENCTAININFYTNYLTQITSGGVVDLYESTIKNCYVQGKITSGRHFNAGLVARANNKSEISNNIVNVALTPYFGLYEESGNGGIVSQSNGVVLKNNLSLVNCGGKISTIYNPRNNISDNSENNYHLTETTSFKNEGNGINEVSINDINEEFFRDKLKLDTNIWNIENSSYEVLPVQKGVTQSFNDGGFQPENTSVYIPDYNRISHLDNYNKNKEVIYHNMYKLMPFYDAKEILTDGNKIGEDSILNKKTIKYVLPYDKNEKMVSVLTTDNYKSLSKISVVFDDGTEIEYNIDFDDYYGDVASYIVSDLNIGYNYNKFVIDKDANIISELIDIASDYKFTNDLDPITQNEESRLYKEYYDNVTKKDITNFVEKTLVNSGYMPTFDSDILDVLIRQEILESGKLKEMLFAYNYFRYWYDLDMDGIDVADSIMFHGDEMFDERMTLYNISSELVSGSNSATNVTGNFYSNYLSKYTRKANLGEFLDYYAVNLTDYKSGEEWFKNNWNSGVYIPISIDCSDTYYTMWDHLKRSGNVQNTFLPLFNVPENSMYVITSPTQVFYGSLRIYLKDPNDKASLQKFKDNEMATFTRQVKNFYKFAHDYVGADTLNKYVDIQYDMRTTYTEKGTVYNNPKTTEENYHKYFAEAVNKWPASNGSGAYATGSEVYWNVIKLISGFNVSTHETLHNQDSKIFLKGYGRRGTAEDYTAGNLQQYYNEGWVSPNIMEDFPIDKENITQNTSYKRIETNDQLTDFYKKYFELNDFLDYIEAMAFIQLTDEQKAAVATQVYYPNLENATNEEKKSVIVNSQTQNWW